MKKILLITAIALVIGSPLHAMFTPRPEIKRIEPWQTLPASRQFVSSWRFWFSFWLP